MDKKAKGEIHLITGCMFAGKSALVIDRLKYYLAHNKKVLAIRFSKDDRYSKNSIASHNGTSFRAYSAATTKDVEKLIGENSDIDVFGIDEIQFFQKELVDILITLKNQGKKVYAAGLDTDFLANSWETFLEVKKVADTVKELKAICSICNKQNGTRTQRLINGKPASAKSPRFLIGDTDSYTARCKKHHEIPS